jgi:hypothetical protein
MCVYDIQLEDVNPPFATIVHYATVTKSLKGDLRIGEKIEVGFPADNLPRDKNMRTEFVANANKQLKGSLRFGFLSDAGQDLDGRKRFSAWFVDVPEYDPDMEKFLQSVAPGKGEGEQGGAVQPATAPRSKPEGDEKPKPESDGHPQ